MEEIEESKYILDLKKEGDKKADKIPSYKTWKSSLNFLAEYSKFIYEKNNVIISAPKIFDGNDDSIDLLFEVKEKYTMLINVSKENDKIIASYYGKYYESENEIKGKIQTGKIHKPLADWMKNYLKV